MGLLPESITAGSTGHLAHSVQAYKKLNGLVLDVKNDFGATGLGLVDETDRILDAIGELPSYASGTGSGGLYFPPGQYLVEDSIEVPSGVHIFGPALRGALIIGNVDGPILTTPSDVSGNPISAYQHVHHLQVKNTSTHADSRALLLVQTSHAHAMFSSFQTAGGHTVELRGAIVSDVAWNRVGGGTGAETGIYLNGIAGSGAINKNRVLYNHITDSKSAVRALQGYGNKIVGNHAEAIAGGATSYTAAFSFSSLNGGSIRDNSMEASNVGFMAFYTAINKSNGLTIDANDAHNPAGGIDIAGLENSTVGTNAFYPGANAPNMNGVIGSGSSCAGNVIHPQHLASGSGVPVNLIGDAATANLDLSTLFP